MCDAASTLAENELIVPNCDIIYEDPALFSYLQTDDPYDPL
jgi:hypothetical protein